MQSIPPLLKVKMSLPELKTKRFDGEKFISMQKVDEVDSSAEKNNNDRFKEKTEMKSAEQFGPCSEMSSGWEHVFYDMECLVPPRKWKQADIFIKNLASSENLFLKNGSIYDENKVNRGNVLAAVALLFCAENTKVPDMAFFRRFMRINNGKARGRGRQKAVTATPTPELISTLSFGDRIQL